MHLDEATGDWIDETQQPESSGMESEQWQVDENGPSPPEAEPTTLQDEADEFDRRVEAIGVWRGLLKVQLWAGVRPGSVYDSVQDEIRGFARSKLARMLGQAGAAEAPAVLPFTPQQIQVLKVLGSLNPVQLRALQAFFDRTTAAPQVLAPRPLPALAATPAPMAPRPMPVASAPPAPPERPAARPASRPSAPAARPAPKVTAPSKRVPQAPIRRPRKGTVTVVDASGMPHIVSRQEPAMVDDVRTATTHMSKEQKEVYMEASANRMGAEGHRKSVENPPVFRQQRDGGWKKEE